MRCLVCVLGVVCAVLCATTAHSGPVTDSISFQGRLTDAGDNPVSDGPRDLIMSFWSDPVGGTMLYSELRSVDVVTGLYATCIGCDNPAFFDIFTDQSIYLEVQLAGEPPMSPRTALRYAPRSLISARVHGDVLTEPGRLHVTNNIGSMGLDGVAALSDDTSSSILVACCLGSSGQDGVEIRVNGSLKRIRVGNLGSSGQDGVELVSDGLSSAIRVNNIGSSGQDGVEIAADGSSRVIRVSGIGSMGLDGVETVVDGGQSRIRVGNIGSSGEDGVEILADATERKLRVSNLGSSGQDGVEARVDGSSSSLTVSNIGSSGLDGVAARADGSSSRLKVSNLGSSGLDGVSIVDDVDGSSVQMARKRPGRVKYSNITLRALPDSLIDYRDNDSDDDGLIDTRLRIRLGDDGSASGTGIAGAGGQMRMEVDHDDDGVPETEFEQRLTPTTSAVAIKSKGTGADPNRSAGVTAEVDDTTATIESVMDLDGDGVPDIVCSSVAGPGTARHAIKTKGTGADANRTARQKADVTLGDISVSSVIDEDGDDIPETEYEQRLTSTSSSFAIKTKGTGADPNRVIGGTDDTTAVVLLATDSASISMRVRKGGTVNGNIIVNSGSALRMVDLDSDGNGFFATGLGVGVDPTHQIDVAGGAYCDGTDWVNASDEDSKENFTEVDGEVLLEKIEELPVTQWNYKNDSDDKRHIGPTAQDFQQTFGVGSNGKSISTIDPSGIALAAIKQLSKQNRELKAQNTDLQKQLDEIKAQVESLLKKQ